MAKVIEAQLKAKGKRIGIVVSRFNDFITTKLLEGCLSELKKHGVKDSQLTVAWVPGAFEIPVAALKLAKKKNIDAVVCLGAVIRGETIHFDLIAKSAAEGISQIGLSTGKPCVFGVLTTDTLEQAIERAGSKSGNKGVEAAIAAIEMANLYRELG